MPINWFTVVAQAINFLILVWLLKRFLYKPILHAIDEREKGIATQLAEAEAKKNEAQKERDDFQHKNQEFDQQRAVLLKNHGVVVTGATIAEAVIGAIMLENGAMVQLLVEAAGDPAPEFSRADIEKLKADITQPEQFTVNFDYLVRRVKRRR